MFETYHVPALYIENDALLSVCSTGISSAIVCNIGDDATTVVPVKDYKLCSPC